MWNSPSRSETYRTAFPSGVHSYGRLRLSSSVNRCNFSSVLVFASMSATYTVGAIFDLRKVRCFPSAETSGRGFQSGPLVCLVNCPRESPFCSSTRMDQTFDSELEFSSPSTFITQSSELLNLSSPFKKAIFVASGDTVPESVSSVTFRGVPPSMETFHRLDLPPSSATPPRRMWLPSGNQLAE